MKCKDAVVATALTSAHSEKQWQRFPNFIPATLPLAASRICGFLGAALMCIGSISSLTGSEDDITYSRGANNILIKDSNSIST